MNKLLSILILTVLIFSSGCERQKAAVTLSGNVVKVGVIAPLSGPDKKSGENALLGIRTALHMQPYLKNGDKIELVVEDNKGTPEQTVAALENLSRQEDVSGVLLMAKSDIVLTLVPVADKYRIPIVSLIATHPDITRNNSFISQLGFDDNFQGTVAALYVRDEMLINRVAVFSDPGNAHYTFLANDFIRKFTSVGGEIIEHINTVPQAGELPKILEQQQEKNVQLLYLAVQPEQVINIVRSADKAVWNPRVMGSDGLLASIILNHEEDLQLVHGIMATDFYSTVLPKTEYGQQAAKLFKKLFSEPGTSYTALGCEGASIFLNALDRCDNLTNRSCVNFMLRTTKGFEGIFGRITIREDGKAERPIFVNDIEDRQMKFLVKVY